MLFCEKCRNAYNVTKDVKNKQVGGKTGDRLDNLFNKFLSEEEITENDINKINYKDIYSDERYDTMNKKNQKKFISTIKAIDKTFFVADEKETELSNSSVDAYLICRFCKNSKLIEPGTSIYSWNYDQGASVETEDYAHNKMIYDYTLPRTKNYICKNLKCKTHKNDELKEAVLTKNVSEKLVYICTECNTNWINTI